MSPPILTLSGKRFVVLPESEYRKLKAKAGPKATALRRPRRARKPTAQELGDIAESRRRLSSEPSIPLEEVRKRLGV